MLNHLCWLSQECLLHVTVHSSWAKCAAWTLRLCRQALSAQLITQCVSTEAGARIEHTVQQADEAYLPMNGPQASSADVCHASQWLQAMVTLALAVCVLYNKNTRMRWIFWLSQGLQPELLVW